MNMTFITVRNALITHAAAAMLALGATAAHAADPAPAAQPPTKLVQFGDLNINSKQGLERLYQRIVAAANEVCQRPSDRSLLNFEMTRICMKQTIAKTVAAVGNPALAALYTAKSGETIPRVAQLRGH